MKLGIDPDQVKGFLAKEEGESLYALQNVTLLRDLV